MSHIPAKISDLITIKFSDQYCVLFQQILVTVNYRLGPLGFMSTSNDDMPANLGLWDQKLALQWVQSHIKNFGGNPNKVTATNLGKIQGTPTFTYIVCM